MADENSRCTRPPGGWTCSRPEGHQGPCAASPPAPPDAKEVALKRLLIVGEQLSNVAFNLAQRDSLDPQTRADLNRLRRTWDAVRAEWREVSRG